MNAKKREEFFKFQEEGKIFLGGPNIYPCGQINKCLKPENYTHLVWSHEALRNRKHAHDGEDLVRTVVLARGWNKGNILIDVYKAK